MSLNELLTLLLTFVNILFVVLVAIFNVISEKRSNKINKKSSWLNKEVISMDKIDFHLEELVKALESKGTIAEICDKIDQCMLNFFYNCVNYIYFINPTTCQKIKEGVLNAMDEVLFSVVSENGELSKREIEKLSKMYKVKIAALLYELDMNPEEL